MAILLPNAIRESRRNRITGATISLEDADHPDRMCDRDGGRWVTFCESHGYLVNHETLAAARSWMAFPDWCPECQEIMRAKGTFDR